MEYILIKFIFKMATELISLLILMTCFFATSGYGNRILKFEKMPTSANVDGLGCALEQQTTAHGVKFNAHTKDCVSLTESWFTAQTQEANYTYFKLCILEEPFSSTVNVGQWLPSTFAVGSSVVMFVTTGQVKQWHEMNIRFRDKPTRGMITMLIRADFKPSGADVVLMNVYVNSRGWGWGPKVSSPFKASYTEYKLEFVLTETHMEVKVDGTRLYLFKHRTSISNYKWLDFHGGNRITCQRIQFIYAV